jgi:DNA-binding transcriptional MerR regulator
MAKTTSHTPAADEPAKRYYGIAEVAELIGVNASVLRFWESEFPALQPKKTKTGRRLYSTADLDLLRQIVYLVRERKYTLEGARTALRQEHTAVAEALSTRQQLEQLRDFLVSLRSAI